MLFYDSHCHLQDIGTLPVLTDNIARVLSLSTKESNWDDSLLLLKNYKNINIAMGVHPWYCDELSSNWAKKLESLLIDNSEISIGEIGLDFKLCTIDESIQVEVFTAQLSLAKKYNRICSIHNINRWDLLFNVLDKIGLPNNGAILHSFNGSLDIANRLIQLGFYISISSNIIGCSQKRKDVVKKLPLDRLLIETDSPYQVPKSWLEKESSPNYINRVYKEVARIKSISLSDLSVIIEENYNSLFSC